MIPQRPPEPSWADAPLTLPSVYCRGARLGTWSRETWFESQFCNIILCDLEKHNWFHFPVSTTPLWPSFSTFTIPCLCQQGIELHQHFNPIRTSRPLVHSSTNEDHHFHGLFSLVAILKFQGHSVIIPLHMSLISLTSLSLWHTRLAKPQTQLS